MKKTMISAIVVASLMGSVAFADAPTFTCPAASTVHPVQDGANPNQYDYVALDLAGAGAYVSMTTKTSPVAVSAFQSADLLHHTIFNSMSPSHCYYQLADGSIVGLHSMLALGPFEALTPASGSNWTNEGTYDHCTGNDAQDCAWNIKIVNPTQQK